MMHVWAQSYAKRSTVFTSATLSVAAHALLIAAAVYRTLPPPGLETKSFENKPYYLPPPDRTPTASSGSHETVHYVDFDRPGFGEGDGEARQSGVERPTPVTESIGRMNADTTNSVPLAPVVGEADSVFSELQVDTAVVRSANSAAPAYPLKLLQAHVMGFVSAQYVVDTTGFADTSTFHVVQATNTEFVNAVREALPYMRFTPAKIGPSKVRQLVEQMFSFKILDTAATVAKRKP